jgi:S-(hydroxymethyl)glutathione dehydrogenase/alcohol dehydrogenase
MPIHSALAAISTGNGKFSIASIEVSAPQADEVLVQIKASGVCHTDWDSLSWGKTHILGHEGAGVVLAVGENVRHVAAGDPVLLNWAISCGTCFQCQRGNHAICERHSPVAGRNPMEGHAHAGAALHEGTPIARSFNIGTLSSHTVVRKEAVVKIPCPIPFPSAAIMGCGVMTGYGSAVNAAKVEPGSAVVVIGCGGVGLNVIQGARIAGAATIIAVDLQESRLAMAKQFGATHLLQSKREDAGLKQAAQEVRALTDGRGADYAFEATANPALGAAPLAMCRHGGTAVQVSGIEQDLTIDMNLFEWDKLYLNPLYGKCCPDRDFPRLFRLYQSKQLLLDELVTRTYALDELGLAFEDMHHGRNAKGVIVFA